MNTRMVSLLASLAFGIAHVAAAEEPYQPDPFNTRCEHANPAEILLHCGAGDVIDVPVEAASAICDMREQIVTYKNQKNESRALCIARGQLRTQGAGSN